MIARGLTGAPHGHAGLTPKEGLIMADWDEGLTIRQIARKHGFAHDAVARTVSYYDGTAEYPKFCRATVTASNQLANAIARAFPERAPA